MKIIVDWDLCEANAVCMARCPEVFRVEDNDELQILDEHPPEALRAKVEAAVNGCPRNALRLEED
jgi:ferredoxin